MRNTDRWNWPTRAVAIACGTCVATGTTACHLLANDDGPIDLVSVTVGRPPPATEWVISLFERAGLLDDPIQFIDIAAFEQGLQATVGAVP